MLRIICWQLLFFLVALFLPNTVYAVEVLIGEFIPFESEANAEIETKIQDALETELLKKGFVVKHIKQGREEALTEPENETAKFYLDGYYKTEPTISIYVQIYDPKNKTIIDAESETLNIEALKDIELDPDEINRPHTEVIHNLAKQVSIDLELNPGKKENQENIREHLLSTPIYKAENFTLEKSDTRKEAKKAFDLLQEDESISIVSKKVGVSESVSKTSAIVSVYNRQKVQDSGARNLADLLKQVPGVEISYDQFGFYKVAFRGVISKSGVLMLLDGHRINNFYDGSTFLDIRADAIDKVEIIRGPGSSVHGTNAFVGVINVVTRGNGKNNKEVGHLSSRVGLYNTIEPSASYQWKLTEDWKFNTYIGQYESRRPQVHLSNDQSCTNVSWNNLNCNTTLVPLPLNQSIRTNDRKKQSNVFLGLNKGEAFYIRGKAIKEERGPNVGELGYITPESELSFLHLIGEVGTEKISIGEKLSFNAKLYTDSYNRNDEIQVERKDFISHIGMSSIKKNGYQYRTLGSELIFQYEPIHNLSMQVGFQLEKLSLNHFYSKQNYIGDSYSNLQPFFYDYDNLNTDLNDTALQYALTGQVSISGMDNLKRGKGKERFIQGEFIQMIWNPTPWLSITLGGRRDRYSDFGKTFNPKSGFVITPFEKTNYGTLLFKFLYGTAFRAPTFKELYDKTQTFQEDGVLGNRVQILQTYGLTGYGSLKPETIQTGELGIEYFTPYKPLNVQLNGFYTRVFNNIDGINTAGTMPGRLDLYRNHRGLSIVGNELEFRLNYSKIQYVFMNLSWFQATDFGGYGNNVNTDNKTFLTNVPQARANIGVNWDITKYVVVNNTVWISSERHSNVRFEFERLSNRGFKFPQYHIWNASIASTEELVKNLELRMSLFNILNYKLYDDSSSARVGYVNRAIPSSFIYQRYIEFKATYYLR
jgi:outer membrane receptor for ferrienterochelin and colicin